MSLYLIALVFQYRVFQLRRGLWLLVNGVCNGGHFAFIVAPLSPCDISGFFKLPYGGADSVDTFPVDMGQSQSSGKDSICDNAKNLDFKPFSQGFINTCGDL